MLHLADERKQESLDGFWPTMTPAQRDGITAIAMDMWEPYVQSTRAHPPGGGGQARVRKFHVIQHLHDAVDHVRSGFRPVWEYQYTGAGQTFTRWYLAGSPIATSSPWRPAVAKLIRRHLPNLLTYLRHRLANARLEGVSAVIQWAKEDRPWVSQRRALQGGHHCGGLDLYSHETQ